MRTPWQHLFHPANAAGYRAGVDATVDHLLAHVADTGGRPLSGMTPREAARRVAGVGLRPPARRGATRRWPSCTRLWLDDADLVPTSRPLAAHLNCPVVIPALMAEVLISAVNSKPRHLRPERRRHVHRAPPRRLDGRPGSASARPRTASSPRAAPSPTCRPCCSPAWQGQDAQRPPAGCGSSPSADGHFFGPQGGPDALGVGDDAVVAGRRRRVAPDGPDGARCGPGGQRGRRDRVPMAVVATAGTTDFGAN